MNRPFSSELPLPDQPTDSLGGVARPERRLRWAMHGALLTTALAMATAGGLHAFVGAAVAIALAFGVVEPAVRSQRRRYECLAGQATHLERLALVAERMNNVVIITDAARRVVWANDAFVRVTGFSLAEAVGRKPSELLQTAATDATTVRTLRAALDAGQGVRVELLNRSKDGAEYWLDIDIQPLHDPAGRLSGFLAVATDITAQVFQQQRLRALFHALPTGVVEQDACGAIVDANLAAEEMLGLTREKLLGCVSLDGHWRTLRDDLSPYPSDDFPIARSLRDGISVRGESMGLLTSQGEQRWLLINSDPLRNMAGKVTGSVAVTGRRR